MPDPPKYSIVIERQEATFNCGLVTITLYTTYARHLWLYWSQQPPQPQSLRDFYGLSARSHRFHYSPLWGGRMEQLEDGDTLIHTFRFAWFFRRPTLYYTFVNYPRELGRAVYSPIFAVELGINPRIVELWGDPLAGRYPWVDNSNLANFASWRQGLVALFRIQAAGTNSIQLNKTNYPAITDILICGGAFEATYGAVQAVTPGAFCAAYFIAEHSDGSFAQDGYLILAHGIGPGGDAGWPFQNATVPTTDGQHGSGQTYSLGQLLGEPQYPPGWVNTLASTDRLRSVELVTGVVTAVDPNGSCFIQNTSIAIGTTTGELERIDATWRWRTSATEWGRELVEVE